MNTFTHWKRRALHGLTLLAILAVALGAPTPARAAAPLNDEIDNAVNLATAPTTITMSDTDFVQSTVAVDDPVIPCNGGPGWKTIWYTFVPTVYGEATIDTIGSQFDTVLAVWTGVRGSLQHVACNDDAVGTTYNISVVKVTLRPGVRYYIEVAQYTGGSGAPQKSLSAPRDIGPLVSASYLTLNLKFLPTPVATVGKYDNKDALWKYVGLWSNVVGTPHYLGSIHRTLVVGKTATINFDGNQFTFYFMKASIFGRMEVRVDGILVGTITQTNSTVQYQQAWVSPVFSNGIHTLELKNVYKYGNVDAILITAPPDPISPDPVTDLATVPGASYGTANLSWTATGDDGSDGLAKAYQVRYSTSPISNLAAWNAATPITTGVPVPKIPGSAESMNAGGLTPGLTYYFAVRVQDEQGNLSAVSNSPSAATGFSGPPATAGIYDNLNAHWMYSGVWTKTNAALAYLGSYHLSRVVGNSAAFVFDGIKFTLLYSKNSYHGNLDVYVDDVFVVRINQFNATPKYQQKYISPLLSSGQHTVKFVHATGKMASVDAIEVIQTPDVDNPAAVGSLAAAPGTANGNVNLTWIAPVEDATAGTGTALYYLGRYSLNPIATETDWNAATPIPGMPIPKAPLGVEIKVVIGLVPGVEYYFSVRAADEFDNLGSIVSVSARAKSPIPAGTGKYDNRDARILYTNWVVTAQAGAYLSSFHLSSLAGRTATFVFNGSDFSLIYARNTAFGNLEVWVDGVLVGVINQNGASTAQQVWKYSDSFGPLTAGQHTVVFRHASGLRVNVDAIEVFP